MKILHAEVSLPGSRREREVTNKRWIGIRVAKFVWRTRVLMFGDCERWMACISAAILGPHIDDARIGTLCLYPEGSNKGIFRINPDVTGSAVDFNAHCETHQ
jgi:hypothetical protein